MHCCSGMKLGGDQARRAPSSRPMMHAWVTCSIHVSEIGLAVGMSETRVPPCLQPVSNRSTACCLTWPRFVLQPTEQFCGIRTFPLGMMVLSMRVCSHWYLKAASFAWGTGRGPFSFCRKQWSKLVKKLCSVVARTEFNTTVDNARQSLQTPAVHTAVLQ